MHRPAAVAILIDLQPSPKRHTTRTMKKINSVSIKGFRSLADVELTDLPNVAVMVGANGSGKSNFLRFFEMLHWMMKYHRLDEFIQRQGGANDQLFGGGRVSSHIEAQISIRNGVRINDYDFGLSHATPNRFVFSKEAFRFRNQEFGQSQFVLEEDSEERYATSESNWESLGSNHYEAKIVGYRCENDKANGTDDAECDPKCLAAKQIVDFFKKCNIYQFNDTSMQSNLKINSWDIKDNASLNSDGGNLASVLWQLEQGDKERFDYICYQISRILPGFDRFFIDEIYGKASLKWKATGSSQTFGAHLTSDGSLRFFALVALLHLPTEMLPEVIILDEPELGLHPAAISLLSGMIRVISHERQVVVATQSPRFIDEFGLNEIIVLNVRDGKTEMHQLDEEDYRGWLEEYSAGELWQTNTFGGTPWYA